MHYPRQLLADISIFLLIKKEKIVILIILNLLNSVRVDFKLSCHHLLMVLVDIQCKISTQHGVITRGQNEGVEKRKIITRSKFFLGVPLHFTVFFFAIFPLFCSNFSQGLLIWVVYFDRKYSPVILLAVFTNLWLKALSSSPRKKI